MAVSERPETGPPRTGLPAEIAPLTGPCRRPRNGGEVPVLVALFGTDGAIVRLAGSTLPGGLTSDMKLGRSDGSRVAPPRGGPLSDP